MVSAYLESGLELACRELRCIVDRFCFVTTEKNHWGANIDILLQAVVYSLVRARSNSELVLEDHMLEALRKPFQVQQQDNSPARVLSLVIDVG